MRLSYDFENPLPTRRARRSAFAGFRDVTTRRTDPGDASRTMTQAIQQGLVARATKGGQMAGIIIGSSISIGIVLSVLLFALFYWYNRRRQTNDYSPTNDNSTIQNSSLTDTDFTEPVLRSWARGLIPNMDESATSASWSAADSRPSSSKHLFVPTPPERPVPSKAAAVLGLAEDAHQRPYSPYNRASTPYDRCSDTASTRAIHTLTPHQGTTMDDAFNDLAVELIRGTGGRSTANDWANFPVIPSSTPTVFPEDFPIRTTRSGSFETPHKRTSGTPTRCESPVHAPPRNSGYRQLTGGAQFKPHQSRYPEGAFF